MSEPPCVETQPVAEPPIAVSAEDAVAAPRRTGHSRVDLILALTAVFVSIVSLFIAMENVHTQREMVSASTWPFVGAFVKIGGDEHNDIQFGISNSGVGPAKVQSFEVFYKDKPVANAIDLLWRCCGLSADRKAVSETVSGALGTVVSNNIVLRAGEDLPVMSLRPDAKNAALAERFARALGDVSFRICYCSVLDECWANSRGATEVARVKTCPVPERPFEANRL